MSAIDEIRKLLKPGERLVFDTRSVLDVDQEEGVSDMTGEQEAALLQFFRAERYVRVSYDLTTHRQTEANLERERAYQKVCRAFGLPVEPIDDDILELDPSIRDFEP